MVLRRDGDVSAELWNALGRNIAPGASTRASDNEVVVPLERFLAARNWLGTALRTYNCDAQFDAGLTTALERADAERSEVVRLLSAEPMPDPSDPVALEGSRFCRELRSFQVRDLGHILSLGHGANFSVPGAGKTTVAYAVYETERVHGRVERMLVVAPISAFDAWMTEIRECLDPVPSIVRFDGRAPANAEILLVNYHRLASSYDAIAEWVLERACAVVLDEAHRMKRGRSGEWGSRCLDLAHLAARRDILTGTPAPQHPSDFAALLEFLWPHQSTRILPADAFRADPPLKTMTEVSKRLRPLFARTNKDELGLDAPKIRVELAEMEPLQAEIYEALRTRMRRAVRTSAGERAMFGDMGGIVMYLLEAATNPALLAKAIGGTASSIVWPPEPIPPESTLAQRVLSYGTHEIPCKFKKLNALVDANARRDRKTLIWSNFVGNLTQLADRVLSPYRPALIYGGIPSGEESDPLTREAELIRFREANDCLVLLANPAAMSEGVSLHHACHDAVYLDRTFNAGQYLQSLDRIHRLGLPPGTETRITLLVSPNTIDETVDERVRVKAERLSAMLSDPQLVTMALPDEEAYGAWIDADDYDALFAHLGVD